MTLTFATPMSMPPAAPTNPPATPPAKVSESSLSVAEIATPWFVAALATTPWFTVVPLSMYAPTPTVRIVTPTLPLTPTNPAARPATMPNSFSLDAACTTRPCTGVVPKLWAPTEPSSAPL